MLGGLGGARLRHQIVGSKQAVVRERLLLTIFQMRMKDMPGRD